MGKGNKGLFLLCGLAVIVLALTACSVQNRQRRAVATSEPEQQTSVVIGVVVENDQTGAQLKIRELDSDVISTLSYKDTSVIMNEYKEERDGEKVEVGEILQASYLPSEGVLVEASVPEDVWSYTEVKKFTFDADQNMLSLVGKKYQYTNMTFCYSGTEQMDPMDFDSQDVLTVRGIGIHVYSVVRTQGHGYIRLANYSDFIGGMAEIDTDMMLPVQDNMLITVAEGTYRVTLLKHRMAATKTAIVADGQETIVDFSDYKKEIKDIGEVTFHIRPEGAELTLNGTSVKYASPVTLHYGTYKMRVSLAGYESYEGVLKVEEKTGPPINIELVEENSKVETKTTQAPVQAPAQKSDSSSDNNSNTVTKKIDSAHTITVTAPEGAEVYLDNVYKGLAPCTFTKVLGSQTITLRDLGYVTKSYSVDILDDNKDAKLSFAELEPEATSSVDG